MSRGVHKYNDWVFPEHYSREEVIELVRKALDEMNSGLGIEIQTYPDGTTSGIDIDEWLKKNLK